MPFLRKSVFYIFLTVYGAVCPLLILHMLGFVYQPGTGLVKTGLIYVATNPPGAQIIIDGVTTHETTPTVVRDLLPGNHDVEIYLKGYVPWQKSLPVAGNKAMALDNVLLVPRAWQINTMADADLDTLIPLTGSPAFLLAGRGNSIDAMVLLRLERDAEEKGPLFLAQSIYKGARVAGYFTVDKSPFFVLHIVEADKDKYLWVDPREKQPHAEDITELLIGEPKQLTWEPSDEKNIFALQGTTVNHLNIKSKAIYPAVMEGVRALGVMDNTIFGLMADGLLTRCDYDGQNKKATAPETKDLLALAGQNPAFLAFAAGALGITADVRGMALDHDRSSALIWTNQRIGILDYSQNIPDHQPNIRWIYGHGRNIAQAFWANNGSNVLARDGGRVFLLDTLDTEDAGKNRLIRVVNVEPDSVVYFTAKTGKLYYLAPNTRRLSWVQIVHHKPVLPAPIAGSLLIKKLEH